LVAHSLTDVQKKEVETSVIAFSYSNNEKLDQAIYRIESDFDISLKLHKCFTMPNKHAYPFAICGLNNNSIMT
jgi:hypothetical protein